VLDRTLAEREFLCGTDYTIADIANYSWYGQLVINNLYSAEEFIEASSYTNVVRWAEQIQARPAVDRGRRVNRPWGPEETRVIERHSAADFK
jgi:GST-like protein